MDKNSQISFNSLETQLLNLIEVHHDIIKKNDALFIENKQLKEKISELLKQSHDVEEENKNLKVVNAISGNEEYKKLMKLQLNRMIKEIDLCILELKNS